MKDVNVPAVTVPVGLGPPARRGIRVGLSSLPRIRTPSEPRRASTLQQQLKTSNPAIRCTRRAGPGSARMLAGRARPSCCSVRLPRCTVTSGAHAHPQSSGGLDSFSAQMPKSNMALATVLHHSHWQTRGPSPPGNTPAAPRLRAAASTCGVRVERRLGSECEQVGPMPA